MCAGPGVCVYTSTVDAHDTPSRLRSVVARAQKKIRSVSVAAWVRRSEPWSLTCGNPLVYPFTHRTLPSAAKHNQCQAVCSAPVEEPCHAIPCRQPACNDLSGKRNRKVTWGRILAAHSRPSTTQPAPLHRDGTRLTRLNLNTSCFINTNTWWILKRSRVVLRPILSPILRVAATQPDFFQPLSNILIYSTLLL